MTVPPQAESHFVEGVDQFIQQQFRVARYPHNRNLVPSCQFIKEPGDAKLSKVILQTWTGYVEPIEQRSGVEERLDGELLSRWLNLQTLSSHC